MWKKVAALCQTESERNFLHTYLGFVKDRQFPMLLPQVWLGIADRRRPDFLAYVPEQYWRYKWFAVQLDAAHGDENKESDARRDAYVTEQNYAVASLRPLASGYLEEVRRLVEQFEVIMNSAEDDSWELAVPVDVARTEEEELPF
ncbi:MAG: hypothetical protein FJ280_32610 [Planctomycetes bacterium]|nr:hypothetical protein [Planctomycetota bacterium]